MFYLNGLTFYMHTLLSSMYTFIPSLYTPLVLTTISLKTEQKVQGGVIKSVTLECNAFDLLSESYNSMILP